MENILVLKDETLYALKTVLLYANREFLEKYCHNDLYPELKKLNKYELIALRMELISVMEKENEAFEKKIEPVTKLVQQFSNEYKEVTQLLEKEKDMSPSQLISLGKERATFQKTLLEAREKAMENHGLKIYGTEYYLLFKHTKPEDRKDITLCLLPEQRQLIQSIFDNVIPDIDFSDELLLEIYTVLK